MLLNVVPSTSCSLHQIKMSALLRKSLDLDLGDWLFFSAPRGDFSLKVSRISYNELLEFGDFTATVSEHSPVLEAKISDVYVEPHNLTIGCDPELFLINKNTFKLVKAHTILPKEAQFGNDGDLAELRPDYGESPEQLMLNLKSLINKIPVRLPKHLAVITSSYFAQRCSGFHIHLGMPIELISFAAENTGKFIKNVVSALDYYIGIPAMFLDNDDKRRTSQEYGNPGDYRLSMRTLEYRTPGGFHLSHPAYARTLIHNSYFLMDKMLKEAEEETEGWTVMGKVVDYSYFTEKFGVPERKYVKELFPYKNKLAGENDKIQTILKNLMGDDYIKPKKIETNKNLFERWLDEKEYETHLHKEKGQTNSVH